MPNHVVNEVIFENLDQAQVEALKALLISDDSLSFEVLLPIPLNAWLGGVGSKHKRLGLDALDWCSANWGTKWGPYRNQAQEFTDTGARLVFDTAWSPPYGWLVALLNKSGMNFRHNWLSEGESTSYESWWRIGDHITPFSNYDWEERALPEDCDLHRHLHLLRWGVEKFEEEDE